MTSLTSFTHNLANQKKLNLLTWSDLTFGFVNKRSAWVWDGIGYLSSYELELSFSWGWIKFELPKNAIFSILFLFLAFFLYFCCCVFIGARNYSTARETKHSSWAHVSESTVHVFCKSKVLWSSCYSNIKLCFLVATPWIVSSFKWTIFVTDNKRELNSHCAKRMDEERKKCNNCSFFHDC